LTREEIRCGCKDMIVDIIEILTIGSGESKAESQYFINHKNKEYSFLVMLSPLVDWLYHEFQKVIANDSLVSIKSLVIRTMIRTDFEHYVSNMISRVCALEMNHLSTQGVLLGDSPEDRFNHFITLLTTPNIAIALLKKYTVLMQRLEAFIVSYLDAKKIFLVRLQSDIIEINHTFFQGDKDQKYTIHKITSLGDLHCESQSVSEVDLSSSSLEHKKVMYKPRDFSIYEAYEKFVFWFNQHSKEKLYSAKFINKKLYGWSQFISYAECDSLLNVQKYYSNLGVLLSVMHLLSAIDIHSENVIAQSEAPVPIDLECLCTPTILKQEGDFENSVLTTLMIPYQAFKNDKYSGINASAFGHMGVQILPYQYLTWCDLGLDSMHCEKSLKEASSYKNIPSLMGENINPYHFYSYFLSGFEIGYLFLLKNKNYLEGTDSPLHFFKNQKVRVIFRPTALYSKFILESFHPKLLYSESEFNSYFEHIKSGYEHSVDVSEYYDLYRSNIPYFSSKSNQKTIKNSKGEKISQKSLMTGLKNIEEKVRSLSLEDLQRQKNIIEKAFAPFLQ
jgi:type 2 lantibiotic biosynthesis protein LanM